MLNEGIVIAERAGRAYIVGEWQEQLLSIYEEMHDVAKIIEMCRLLFIHTDGSLGYFIINSNHWCLRGLERVLKRIDAGNHFL